MARSRGVDITGRGVIAGSNASLAGFATAILSGTSAIGSFADLQTGYEGVPYTYKFSQGAPVRGFDPAAHFDERTLTGLDRFSQFAAVAARQAIAEAGLRPEDTRGERIAVIIGTANTGIDSLNEAYFRFYKEDRKPRPLTVPMTMGSAPASRIAREIGALGPVFGVTSACASGAHAILVGMNFIRAGMVDVALVGGTDSCFREGYLRGWDALRVVSPDTCRPFSTERRGLIIGEGAGILVLEAPGRAAARGGRPVATLLGAGMSSDAGDLIAPDASGMSRAMRAALADAGAESAGVDYVNAHGTGTLANDRLEARAICDVFGARSDAVSVSSTKSMIGHAMGASGALEALATIIAIETGTVPPTANFLAPDPECPIDATPNQARKRSIDVALSNSFAFGGLNVSLAFAGAADR